MLDVPELVDVVAGVDAAGVEVDDEDDELDDPPPHPATASASTSTAALINRSACLEIAVLTFKTSNVETAFGTNKDSGEAPSLP